LRDLDAALRQEPSAGEAQLHQIMERYYDWWKTLTPVDRYNLSREDDVQKRLLLVKQLRSDQAARISVRFKDSDSEAISSWARDLARVHRAEIPAIDEQRPDVLGRRRAPWVLAYEAWWSAAPTVKFPPVTDAELHALSEKLSLDKQTQFNAQPGLYER